MNPLKFKSLCININTHDLITSLAEEILPYGRMTRSQVVNLAVNRLKQQMYKGEVSVGTFNKPKNLNNLVKIKLPEPEYIGTAITSDEIEARNKAIYHHRIVAHRKLTLQQLGTMYNITRERVRQIQDHEVSTKKLNQQPKDKHASNN